MVLLIMLLFIVSCTKDKGYYAATVADKTYPGNTYDYLKSKHGVYDSLLLVVDRLGLKKMLSDSNITLFAVTNSSFRLAITNLNNLRLKLDKEPIFLKNIDIAQLDTMVCEYIIKGKILSDSMTLQDGLNMSSIRYDYPMHGKLVKSASSGYITGGSEMIEYSNTNRSQFVKNWVTTTTGSNNVKTSNGIIHIITPDHIFGFNQFVSRLTYIPPPPNLFIIVGGKLTVSAENPGGVNSAESSQRAVDRDSYTKFLHGNFISGWLKFELKTATVSNAYAIMSANDFQSRDPRSWNVDGSNDDRNWTYLDSRIGENFKERYMERVFVFDNKTPYKFYRITFTEMFSGSDLQLAEWSMNFKK